MQTDSGGRRDKTAIVFGVQGAAQGSYTAKQGLSLIHI